MTVLRNELIEIAHSLLVRFVPVRYIEVGEMKFITSGSLETAIQYRSPGAPEPLS